MSSARDDRVRVFVAGGTGYLGKYVLEVLHEQKDKFWVRALARNEAKGATIAECVDEVVYGDVLKPATLTELFDGIDVVFSCVGLRTVQRYPRFQHVDKQGNLDLLAAAKAAGVKRVSFISVAHGDRPEARKIVPTIMYRESVVDWIINDSGFTYTIIRPTGFFNDMQEVFGMCAEGRAWLLGDGTARINPIHGRDLAELCVESLHSDQYANAAVTVGGPDILSYNDIADLAFKSLGVTGKKSYLPAWTISPVKVLVWPFQPMLKQMADFFQYVFVRDVTGEQIGTHHLADWYQELADKHAAAQEEKRKAKQAKGKT